MIESLKKIIENDFANIDITGKDLILETLSNQTYLSDKDFPIYFGKLATMSGLLLKLDKIMNDYNKLYSYLSENIDMLKHDEAESYDIIELWKDIYKAKKTHFYVDQLLKYDIYFYYYQQATSKTIMLEDALKNLVKPEPTVKITILVDDTESVKSQIDYILKNLDNTVVSVDHLNFFIENMVLTFFQGLKTPETDLFISPLEKLIQSRKDNLMKSAFLSSNSVYSVLYGNIQQGGADPVDQLVLPANPLPHIEKTDREVLLELFRLYSASILSPSDKSPMTMTNQKQIERTINLTYMMLALYDKINLKLGAADDQSMYAPLTEEQKQIKKYKDFYDFISKKSDSLTDSTVPKVESTNESKSTVLVTRPRLDIYRDRLVACKDELKPYIKNITILRNLLFETKAGTFSIDETKVLIKLYNEVKRQIDDGINSYIKLIPMIFFTIEFPPAVYSAQKCKYRFTFNTKKEQVEYKFIEGQDKADCNNLGLGTFDEKEFAGNALNSHAAFFESNKLNGTRKLIDDPVIGLGKLIKPDVDKTNPTNCIINMMFALGASGTGKTTRYFGKSNGHPDDREGIVPFIINKSLEDAKPANEGDPATKEISIAYFVCYGQKSQVNNTDASFNELAIFFNIDSIKKSNGGDAEINEDNKYIPFYMPNPKSRIRGETVNKYTDFYSTVVSKKLDRRTFTELKPFITDGNSFPQLAPHPIDQQKTFREVLETSTDIWKVIDPKESSSIGELFEELIIEQKKINTVLPTKNNIESSRGHTCVLVKIEDKLATTNKIKYFPLFDMAGTENTGQIDLFLTQNRDTDKMAKLIKKVNLLTQTNDITQEKDESKQYPSLNDLLTYENINSYVSATDTNVGNSGIKPLVGGKQKLNVKNFYETNLRDDTTPSPGINFLKKVVKEGYYINHTISMLIFAAMCVGSSLRTELRTGADGKEDDQFDNFFGEMLCEINKFTCVPSPNANIECDKKTLMLLAKKRPSAIVNGSCIWLQVLFSFLYWNEETPSSIRDWLDKLNPNTNSALTYLCEPNVKSTDFISGLITGEQLLSIGQISESKDGLAKLYDTMEAVNKTHQFSAASQRKLGGPVSFVSINASTKLEIDRVLAGQSQPAVTTERTAEIPNPEFEADKATGYKKAFDLRRKMGLTETDAKKAYTRPVEPALFTEVEPVKGFTDTEKSFNSKKTAWEKKKKTYDQTVAKYEEKLAQYNESIGKLPSVEQKEYANVSEIVEYTIPEKIQVVLKLYFDFLENDSKLAELNDFRNKVSSFITNNSDFDNQIKQSKTEKIFVKGKSSMQDNPKYIGSFHTELEAIIKEVPKYFANPPKAVVTKPTPKGKQPTGTAAPVVTDTKPVVLAEVINYKSATSNKLVKPGDRIPSYTGLSKNLAKLITLENIVADIDLILDEFEKKKEEDSKERKGFQLIPDVIAELNKIDQAELITIANLLKVTGGKLKIANDQDKFLIVNKDGNEIGPIFNIIERINQVPSKLPICPAPNDNQALVKLMAENQMHRIKDGRAAATKMTLMHLVTGQGIKHYMVEETIKLCKTLYDSTNLDLSN